MSFNSHTWKWLRTKSSKDFKLKIYISIFTVSSEKIYVNISNTLSRSMLSILTKPISIDLKTSQKKNELVEIRTYTKNVRENIHFILLLYDTTLLFLLLRWYINKYYVNIILYVMYISLFHSILYRHIMFTLFVICYLQDIPFCYGNISDTLSYVSTFSGFLIGVNPNTSVCLKYK